ncbi:thioredoxin [Saccharothrix violaceirubra]|uniref:Thioredoxin 2 n=1 Tax=Saccharothrix violaceirubra TaxID=413306 RepID=A0A7W7T8N4_9PSEU|nr:thioredoxin domain-containing protein [Saccharothrix violaceirubra]MBB4968603.1 thioredoxin 2 [Saccharothrix violaceirubra]
MSTDTAGTVVCEHCGHKNRVQAAASGKPTCGHCHQPLPWIVDAGDNDFAELAERATMPVPVDLRATWWGPCRQVGPAPAQPARERAGKVKLVRVDVDRAPVLSQRFDVKAVPTLMVLRGGEVVARQAGAAPVPVLREWLDQAPARPTSTRVGDVR